MLFCFPTLSQSWHSGQKECLIAGYEKSVKADQFVQGQEEEEFSFLNIHPWKMPRCKEISDVHLIVTKLRKK